MVAHLVWDEGAAGSNPVIPIFIIAGFPYRDFLKVVTLRKSTQGIGQTTAQEFRLVCPSNPVIPIFIIAGFPYRDFLKVFCAKFFICNIISYNLIFLRWCRDPGCLIFFEEKCTSLESIIENYKLFMFSGCSAAW